MLRGFRIGDRVIRHSMVKVVKNSLEDSTPSEIEMSKDHGEPEIDDPHEEVPLVS
jgi:hypothetical protein